jgi:hypothetical protein
MKILKEIRLYLVIAILGCIGLYLNYLDVKEELTKCKTDNGYVPGGDIEKAELQSTIDSLQNEMFVKEIQIGSYEVMWGILEEVNKPLADSINLQVE